MAISAKLSLDSSQYDQGIARARSGVKQLQRDMETAGHSTVSSMQASSAAIRLMEGNIQNNVRAVERLLSSLPGVGAAMQAIFPLVAGVAFAGMIARIGQELYNTSQKAANAGTAIKDSFRTMNDQAETANATLQVSNDRLDDQIAKLTGQHQNTIKDELDEAKLSADKLADSLQADADKLDKLMQANSVGVGGGLAAILTSGKFAAPTTDIDNAVAGFGKTNRDNAGNIHDATLGNDPKAIQAAIDKAKSDLLKQRQQLQAYLLEQEKMQSQDPLTNYSSTIESARGAIRNNIDEYNHVGLTQDNDAKKGTVSGLEQNKSASDAAAKALEERLKFRDKMVETYHKEQADEASHVTELSKIGEEWAAKEAEADNKVLTERKRLSDELSKYQDDLSNIQRKGADSVAEQSIGFAQANGTITAHAAAISLATLHTKIYTQALADLQAQQRAADNVGDTAESQRVGRQIATVQANRQTQVAGDQNSVVNTSMLGQLQALFKVDFPQELRQTFAKFLDDFNESILGKHPGKGLKNAAAGALHSTAKSGLKAAEGGILGAFGIGHGKTGSRSNPMWVQIAGGSGNKSGSGGGIKGIGKSILGGLLGFAGGGDIDPSMGSILVGEEGPEIVQPKSAGRVLTNKQSFGGGSAVTHNHYIDARGATDPAATARMVYQASVAAHNSAVKNSQQVAHEKQRRTPAAARRS